MTENNLTPYDRGTRANAVAWVPAGFERGQDPDKFGRVDFDDDELRTIATAYVGRPDAGSPWEFVITGLDDDATVTVDGVSFAPVPPVGCTCSAWVTPEPGHTHRGDDDGCTVEGCACDYVAPFVPSRNANTAGASRVIRETLAHLPAISPETIEAFALYALAHKLDPATVAEWAHQVPAPVRVEREAAPFAPGEPVDAVASFIDWASSSKIDTDGPFDAETIGAWLAARGLMVTRAAEVAPFAPGDERAEALAHVAAFNAAGANLASYQARELVSVTVTDDGETFAGVRCPWCDVLVSDSEGALIEMDWAVRDNDALVEADDADRASVSVHQGDGDFETLTYLCGSCRVPVGIPEGFDVDWS